MIVGDGNTEMGFVISIGIMESYMAEIMAPCLIVWYKIKAIIVR